MTNLDFGDRHRRAVPGLGPDAARKTVRILAGDVSDSRPRQHLLVCLVNLLSRLHGSVESIQLSVDGDISVVMPHRPGPMKAYDAMAGLALWANGGGIPILPADTTADITIDIGASQSSTADIYGWGAGWKAWVGNSPAAFRRDDAVAGCLGPYFSAAMIAADVFKASRGITKGRLAVDEALSLWSGETGNWEFLEDGPYLGALSLPGLYLVGAGAVGQGVVQVLGASMLVGAYVVTMDHDAHDAEGTNLNRCFLAGVADIGHPKVEVVRRYREYSGLDGFEFHGNLGDYLVNEKPGLRSDMKEAERLDVYDVVVSAVDVNRSRQQIQGLRPRVVVGGSTDSLRAQSTAYGGDGAECLACWNPVDDVKARAIAVEAELRMLSVDERRRRLSGKVDDLDASLAFLASGEPKCGQLGEADIRRFSAAVTPEFSISFVSMAAAVMAASRLFAAVVHPETHSNRPPKSLFQFRTFAAVETTTARRGDCDYCRAGDAMTLSARA